MTRQPCVKLLAQAVVSIAYCLNALVPLKVTLPYTLTTLVDFFDSRYCRHFVLPLRSTIYLTSLHRNPSNHAEPAIRVLWMLDTIPVATGY